MTLARFFQRLAVGLALVVGLSEAFVSVSNVKQTPTPALEMIPTTKHMHNIEPLHAAVIPMNGDLMHTYVFPRRFSNHTTWPALYGNDFSYYVTSPPPPSFPTVQECVSKLWGMYMTSLEERPLLTKAISAALVQALGDFISQSLKAYFSGVHVYDRARTLCFALVGFFYKAPLLSVSYKWTAMFGKRLQRAHKLSDNQRIASELVVDQTAGVLAFYPAYFYVFEFFSAAVNGRAFQFLPFTASGLAPVLSAMCANYAVWPLSQYISFRFIPESLRVLHTNLVAVLWNIYFCARVAS